MMDIDALIRRECPHADGAADDIATIHDAVYAKALRAAHSRYTDPGHRLLIREEVLYYLETTRDWARHTGCCHDAVASCVVLSELLKETE